jgi:hypothetical protein
LAIGIQPGVSWISRAWGNRLKRVISAIFFFNLVLRNQFFISVYG